MRILITGSRNHTDVQLIREAIQTHTMGLEPENVTIVSGGCPTGADRIAERYARLQGFTLEIHPAEWAKHGRAAGPIRNQQMVDAGADVVLAFPLGESRGTKGCIRAAKVAGLTVKEYSAR